MGIFVFATESHARSGAQSAPYPMGTEEFFPRWLKAAGVLN